MLRLAFCNLCFKIDTVTKRLEVTLDYDSFKIQLETAKFIQETRAFNFFPAHIHKSLARHESGRLAAWENRQITSLVRSNTAKTANPQMPKCQRAGRAAKIIIMKMCSACERWGAHLPDAN